jgi:hypothetical protein
VGNGERAELSQLRRQVNTLEKECTKLESQRSILQKQTEEMRGQLKTSRLELKSKTRELTLALGSIERLSNECRHSEATLSSYKEKIRKLEARLATVDTSSSQHHLIERLQQAVKEAEHQLQDAQQTACQLSQENTYLRHGIQLAAQELTRRSGSNIHADLIETLARTQEELASLTAKQQTTNEITVEAQELLISAKDTIQTQYNALLTCESENEGLRSKVKAAELEVETQKSLADELRQLIDALRPRAGALKQQRDALRRAVEVEKEMRQESETEGSVMREKLKVLEAELGALRGELRRVMVLEGTTSGNGGGQDFNLSPLFPSAAPAEGIAAAMKQKDTCTIGSVHQGKEKDIGVIASPAPTTTADHPPPPTAKKVQVKPLDLDFEFTRVEQEIHHLTGGDDDCETPSLIIARLQQHQRQLLGIQKKKEKKNEEEVNGDRGGETAGGEDSDDQQQGDSPGPHMWHTNPLAASSLPSSPLSKPVVVSVPRPMFMSIREEKDEEDGDSSSGHQQEEQEQEGSMIKAVWNALPTTSAAAAAERDGSAGSSEWLRDSMEADIEGLKVLKSAGKMEKKNTKNKEAKNSGRNISGSSGVKLSLFDLANLQLP